MEPFCPGRVPLSCEMIRMFWIPVRFPVFSRQSSQHKRLKCPVVRPAWDSGRGLFPLPTSLQPARSKANRRSKACHSERSLRSEEPRNTPQTVHLFQSSIEADDVLFRGGKCTLAPSFHAFTRVALVRPREILRFEDCAQDDKKGALFRLPRPAVEFVANGKGGLPHSKTLARLLRRFRQTGLGTLPRTRPYL